MLKYRLESIVQNTDREKVFFIKSKEVGTVRTYEALKNNGIPILNLGFELAQFIDKEADFAYLSFDVQSFIEKKVEEVSSLNVFGLKIVAIANWGILFEKQLELNVSNFIAMLSKNCTIILIWDGEIINQKLYWNLTTELNNFKVSENIKLIEL